MDNKKACITCSREFDSDEAVCPDDGTILTPIVKDRYLGTILAGRYEIQQVIGGGGMGLVYKARHVMMNRIVAIKMLHHHLTNSPEALKRFQLEAQAASCLSLPNILTIYDFGVSDEGQPFMVMDYLEGISLADVLDTEKRLSVSRSINIFIQCCAGLAHAHQKGVLHRDLKPSNIMLVNYGEDQADFVKIVDFGIAKLLNRSDGQSANLTRTGEVYGSPLYMSPEQCRGQELDARSDLYSFGCVMYKTLTGLPVFNGTEVIELLFKQVSEMPEPFQKVAADAAIPAELEAIVMKSLAKTPDQRYNSMNELKEVLEAYKRKLEGEDVPPPPTAIGAPGMSSIRLSSKFVGPGAAGAVNEVTKSAAKTAETKVPAVAAPPSETSAAAAAPAASSTKFGATRPGSPAQNSPAAASTNVAPAAAVASTPMSAAPAVQPTSAAAPPSAASTPISEGYDKSALDAIPARSAPASAPAAPSPVPATRTTRESAEHKSVSATLASARSKAAKPDWLLVLEGAFSNKLVLASVAGLLVTAATVGFMAMTSEKAQHIKHTQQEIQTTESAPPDKGAQAQNGTATPAGDKPNDQGSVKATSRDDRPNNSEAEKPVAKATTKTATASSETEDSDAQPDGAPAATSKKPKRIARRTSGGGKSQHRRRHAYSSYGY